ncbi:MAG TPA: GDSL-type esterase/lipase family protein [Gaiellaceae bacterium]
MKIAFVALAAAVAFAVPAASAAPTYPNSIAALGDSITRAFDTCSFPYVDCPANSWSTGTSSGLGSLYERLVAVNPQITGHNFNDAKTGAKMADLPGQAATAAGQQAAAVTILMGANDVCTSSVATMTDPTVLAGQLRTALTTLATNDPNAQIYVASIPNVYRLWQVLHTNLGADLVWSFAGICQSLLANPTSTSAADQARRLQVSTRTQADNAQIASVCTTEFAGRCHFDNLAVYNYPFAAGDITTRDYFHPNVTGQGKLAATEWGAFFGP